MQAYLYQFQRPPPNRLVTRRLECENRYDEDAWGDHHWEDILEKKKKITDTTNHRSPIVSKGSDDIFAKKTPTATTNSTLSESKLGLDDGVQAVDQHKDLIHKDDAETNNSSSCKNSFNLVSRGAKPTKCNESNRHLNISNRFTILEIEPCMESFDGNIFDEHQSFEKPDISKAIKKKKKKKVKRKTTLEHSKVLEEINLKKTKIKNLINCELRCNLCFKAHFPRSKFCRWSEKKNSKKTSVKTKLRNLSEDTINLVKKKIQYLQDGIETMKDVQLKKINETFFKRSQNASNPLNYPDLLGAEVCKASNLEDLSSDISNLKLRGGGVQKVKKYISDTKNINLVLNSLRSSSMLASLNVHNKCPVKSFCNFCLLRSAIFKINV